jgi:hypothetical protein
MEGSIVRAEGEKITLRLMPDQVHLFDTQGMARPRTVKTPN